VGALVAAMVSTFGIYTFASFLYVSQTQLYCMPLPTHWFMKRDPWHMFSSFFQYLCLAPSFVNVLNVYAFCNLHDVSWGTKGSDKAEALPSVSSSKGKGEEAAVVQDTERVQEDLDDTFRETVNRAVSKLDVKEVPEKPSMDDENKTFRTRLVVFWMLSNAGLAMAIENLNGLSTNNAATDQQELQKKQNIYFAFILYSTFGLTESKNASHSACGTSSSATFSGASAGLEMARYRPFVFFSRLYMHFVNYTMDVS
jgi:chitin synthase